MAVEYRMFAILQLEFKTSMGDLFVSDEERQETLEEACKRLQEEISQAGYDITKLCPGAATTDTIRVTGEPVVLLEPLVTDELPKIKPAKVCDRYIVTDDELMDD